MLRSVQMTYQKKEFYKFTNQRMLQSICSIKWTVASIVSNVSISAFEKVARKPYLTSSFIYLAYKMTSDSWLDIIQNARKTAVIEDGKRKVHFLLENGKEMVEEYNMDTNVVVRRAWKEKNSFGTNVGWTVEVGDPELKQNNIELYGIEESSNAPFITRRITRTSLEWRIRNLPYSESVYSVTAEQDGTMTVRTSNKKYFKKLKIPDLERIGLKPEQERISFRHQYNTLIITYKKPPQLLNVEKKILNTVLQLKTDSKDVQCPTS